VCRPHSWQQLGHSYVVTKAEAATKTTMTTTGPKPAAFDVLREKFARLAELDIDGLRDNAFVTDFFASVRINMQAVLDTIMQLLRDNGKELERALATWAEARSARADRDSENEEDDNEEEALVERWKRVTSDATYGERSKTDKEIQLLLERGKMYLDLGAQCHTQLGLRRSIVSTRRVRLADTANLETAFYDDDGNDGSELLPPLSWDNGLSKSIYLNLDWDDDGPGKAKRGQLKWNTNDMTGIRFLPKDALKLKDESYALLYEAASEARIRWLGRLSAVFQEFDAMVGMSEIKEEVANFVLRQIVTPVSPITTGLYVNFVIGGNPGTGKTEVAKKFPLLLYLLGLSPREPITAPLITTRSDWIGEYEGQTATKTRTLLAKNLGELIIIDEAYALVGGERDMFGKEFINQLVNDMSLYRGLLSVMMLGYYERIEKNILKSNIGLARRFNNKWQIRNYTARELFIILCDKLLDMAYQMPGLSTTSSPPPLSTQKEFFRRLVDALPVMRDKTASTGESFNVSEEDMDRYDSIYNVINGLVQLGKLDDINAGAVAALINIYNGLIAAKLVTSKNKSVSVDDFDKEYVTLRKQGTKTLQLQTLFDALVAYAVQLKTVVH
jgi:hypothetical protein